MMSWLSLILAVAVPASPTTPTLFGQYVEVRTCDIWTAACFANAEINLAGKHAVMAWKVERGTVDAVNLDGLGIVAVIAAPDTLGQTQTGSAKAVLIVDEKANSSQRDALIQFAKRQAGDLAYDVIAVHAAPIDLIVRSCNVGACAHLTAGDVAHLETRCIDTHHDKACGNEGPYYPPLARGATVQAAVAVEHGYSGKDFGQTWKETDRRGAYVGSFEGR